MSVRCPALFSSPIATLLVVACVSSLLQINQETPAGTRRWTARGWLDGSLAGERSAALAAGAQSKGTLLSPGDALCALVTVS